MYLNYTNEWQKRCAWFSASPVHQTRNWIKKRKLCTEQKGPFRKVEKESVILLGIGMYVRANQAVTLTRPWLTGTVGQWNQQQHGTPITTLLLDHHVLCHVRNSMLWFWFGILETASLNESVWKKKNKPKSRTWHYPWLHKTLLKAF